MSSKIGIAIIGSGLFVKEEHLPAVQNCSLLSLKAVWSRKRSSANALLRDIDDDDIDIYSADGNVDEQYEILLERDDIQAVIIALPIASQAGYVRSALMARKAILSEKPLAESLDSGADLMTYYHKETFSKGARWAVAENFRFMESFRYGARQVQELGGVKSFDVKIHSNITLDNKYFNTEWRKSPTHQGGFLFDGGPHFIAGTRILLGENPVSLTANTQQLQKHLPPIDTVDATWTLASGITGTFSLSFGKEQKVTEYKIICEQGTVIVSPRKVRVVANSSDPTSNEPTDFGNFDEEGSGVADEVQAFAESVERKADVDERQSAQEGFWDLCILQAMLDSNGSRVNLGKCGAWKEGQKYPELW